MARRVKVAFPLMDGHKSDVEFELDDPRRTLQDLVPEFLDVLRMEGIEPAVQASDENGLPAYTVVMSRGPKHAPVPPSELGVPIETFGDFTALEILPSDGRVGGARLIPGTVKRRSDDRTPTPRPPPDNPTQVLRRQAVQRRYDEFVRHAAALESFVGQVGPLRQEGGESSFDFVLHGVTAYCEDAYGATDLAVRKHPLRVVFPGGYPGKGFELFYDVERSGGLVPFHPNIGTLFEEGASAHGSPGWVCLWETVPPDSPVARALRQFVDMISYRQMNLSDIHPNLNRRAWAAASAGKLVETRDNPYLPWIDEALIARQSTAAAGTARLVSRGQR